MAKYYLRKQDNLFRILLLHLEQLLSQNFVLNSHNDDSIKNIIITIYRLMFVCTKQFYA